MSLVVRKGTKLGVPIITASLDARNHYNLVFVSNSYTFILLCSFLLIFFLRQILFIRLKILN